MSYSDLFYADLEAKREINLQIFMEIAKIINITEYSYSLDDIHSRINKSYEAITNVLSNEYKDCIKLRLKEGVDVKDMESHDILMSLTEKGVETFFINAKF